MNESKDLPNTIKYPETFHNSKPAGYDGVFDWSWTKGCFGNTNITPMDFDGVVERNGHCLIFESKKPGVEIPDGQKWALERLRKAKSFTVMKIWGKEIPERIEMLYKNGKVEVYEGIEAAKERVAAWFKNADSDISESKEDDKACEICGIYIAKHQYKNKQVCHNCYIAQQGWDKA